MPCAIAGAEKLKVAPAANDPALAKISRRLMTASPMHGAVQCPNGVWIDNIRSCAKGCGNV
jgi:hypothetical protein